MAVELLLVFVVLELVVLVVLLVVVLVVVLVLVLVVVLLLVLLDFLVLLQLSGLVGGSLCLSLSVELGLGVKFSLSLVGGVLLRLESVLLGLSVVCDVNNLGLVNVLNGAGLNSSENLLFRSILDEQALREDATFGVVLVVAGVTSRGRVANLAGRKGTGEKGLEWVTADDGNLDGELKNDGLVDGCSVVRGGILVLSKNRDLRVDRCDSSAGDGRKTDLTSVALKSAVLKSCNLASNIASRNSVGESLVGRSLLEAI